MVGHALGGDPPYQRGRRLLPPYAARLVAARRCSVCPNLCAPAKSVPPSLLQVCEQLMTMHLAGRRSAAGKPSPGKPHLLRLSQLAAGVPDAMVSHTKGHADVSSSGFAKMPPPPLCADGHLFPSPTTFAHIARRQLAAAGTLLAGANSLRQTEQRRATTSRAAYGGCKRRPR